MLLDGVGGDVVLSEGRRLARLLRAGHWRTAYREAVGQNRFWNGAYPPGRELAAERARGIRPRGRAPAATAAAPTDCASGGRSATR